MAPHDQERERVVLGVLFVVVLLAYAPTIISFPMIWARSFREHGFLAAALTVWVVWRDRRILLRSEPGAAGLLPALVGVSLLWAAGAVMGIGAAQQASVALVLATWAFAVFGWGARRTILTALATFALAIPFWDAVVPILQRATTIVSGSVARMAGISAVIRGDTITIDAGTFLVEAGCSGINFFLAGLTLGATYAILFVERWQTQAKIVALAGGAAVLGNWMRVTLLVFLGEATSMESPFIEDHWWQGWIIFILLMWGTYYAARSIERRDEATHGAPSESEADAHSPDRARPKRAGGATMAAVTGPLLYFGIGMIPSAVQPDVGPGILGIADEWTAIRTAPEAAPWAPAFHGIDGSAHWTVDLPGGRVSAGAYAFVDQRPGEELIQYSNTIAPDSLLVVDRIVGPIGGGGRILREAIVAMPDGPRIVWYWYRVGGIDTPFDSKAKLLELVAFVRRDGAARLLTLSAPCAPDSCEAAARALRLAMTGSPPA